MKIHGIHRCNDVYMCLFIYTPYDFIHVPLRKYKHANYINKPISQHGDMFKSQHAVP